MPQPIPVRYTIHLQPDLSNFRFEGRCELALAAAGPVSEITLNILQIAVWRCRVRRADAFVECLFTVAPEKEELRIFLPVAMPGKIVLQVEYCGLINDKMAGFYRSRYSYRGRSRYMAVTQFEESDARRAFPCMDHPAAKAVFDITLDIEAGLTAISNAPVKTQQPLEDGKTRVTFEQTPKMSTYLVFFAVGKFVFARDAKDPRVRAATLPGMKKFIRRSLGFGRKALAFSESYYQIDYPLPKMDLIAIPDFAFGAMENWGAITFRENLLLYYPGVTSTSGGQRIFEVIAHEIAHQWFGNLVTPSDWKYLWLNESFATYFGFGVVDHYCPQWEIWSQFLYSQTGPALARDGLHETVAIEIPGGEHVVINISTAPIIYDKGGSILRQIQGYIGDKDFKKGLRHYLKTFAYGSATSRDLWQSLENVSGKPVRTMMKSWVEQPGFPLVEVRRQADRLLLTQKRFTYLPNDADQKWLAPLTIILFGGNGETRRMTVLMDAAEKTVTIDADTVAYKINDRQTGFYRVRYDDAQNLAALGKLVRDKTLSPQDRWGLQNDLYALVKSATASLDDYLQFLCHYDAEDAYLPLAGIADNLFAAYLVMGETQRRAIRSVATGMFEAVLDKIGYDPLRGEKQTTAILRDQLIRHAAFLGSGAAVEFVRSQFVALTDGKTIHPDIMKSVLQVAALTGDNNVFDWLDQRLQSSQVEHERMNLLTALGAFKDEGLIKKAQQYVLGQVPARNKFVPVVSMAANPHAVPLLWSWYTTHIDKIEQFHPMLYERIIAAIVPVAGLDRPDEVQAFFDDYLKKTDTAADVVKMSLERLKINLQMRNSI